MIRVLLIDDHPALRRGLAAFLEEAGDITIVAQASTGAEGIDMFARHHPDVVVTDLRLPDVAGAEVIRQTCAAAPDARFVVLTTFDTEEDMYRAFQAGAVAYLVKDADHQDIVEAIRRVAQGERMIPDRIQQLLKVQKLKVELSAREREVLALAAKGRGNRDIASALSISPETVKTHLERIRVKLDADDRTAAVAKAMELGLI